MSIPCYLSDAELAAAEQGTDERSALLWVWGLRQRDSQRALELLETLEPRVKAWAAPQAVRELGLARLLLVRAEAAILGAEHDPAQAWLDQAAAQFTALDDDLGMADLH